MSEKIKEMFDKIAKNYDKLNNIISFKMHLNVKKSAINNVTLKSDSKVLDVCTGTGDIAIYLASKLPEGQVIGVDFSDKMLKIAEDKLQKARSKRPSLYVVGLANPTYFSNQLHVLNEPQNIEFINADALNLPFKDGEFDACFISFGLRNLDDLKKGLEEMKRVTKEGGFVVNLDTGKPKGIVGFFYNLFFFHIIPIFGKFFNGDSSPYKYLPQSTKKFPSPDELMKIFEEVGLKNVKRYDFLFGAISEQVGEV